MIIKYNKKFFHCNENEFLGYTHKAYNYLNFKNDISLLEMVSGLVHDISEMFDFNLNLYINGTTHGGFIPIKSAPFVNRVNLYNIDVIHINNIKKNIKNYKVKNLKFLEDNEEPNILDNNLIYIDDYRTISDGLKEIIKSKTAFILVSKMNIGTSMYLSLYKNRYYFVENNLLKDHVLLVPDKFFDLFYQNFRYYMGDNNILDYNNLLQYTMIIKNGGPILEKVLKENMPYFDRWTILDTGSTDGTQDVIRRVLANKKGKLYEEPFIDFRESRNSCLDLAGYSTKYIIMLDDTYMIRGDLRKFLETVRNDTLSDSFSLIIKSDDVEYSSNRIIKSDLNLRYKFTIHEVIENENNMNVIIPFHDSHIFDEKVDYMDERTFLRKQLDLKLLYGMVEEEPENPRHFYYLAQTYSLLKQYDKVEEFFLKRINHHMEGFLQEKIDACFELARLYNFRLDKPWDLCEKYYKMAYELDKTRPDSLYFMGIHYYLENNFDKAYEYFKMGFEVGYPLHAQYSLKPTLSYYFLPKFLAEICYKVDDPILGEKCSKYFLDNNKSDCDDYHTMISWYNIFVYINKMPKLSNKILNTKKIICFISDGGFSSWTGRDILTKGVGGSETHTIEMARYIKKFRGEEYDVYVFCRCETEDIFEGVIYKPIIEIFKFVTENHIQFCIISRFSEYLPVAIRGYVENIYLVLHDLTSSGNVLPIHNKLKKIFCLSEWHVKYFTDIYPQYKDRTTHFYYGIDFDKFLNKDNRIKKVSNRFIYSSFPNRGLYALLLIWPRILEFLPDAELHIYSDIKGNWVQNNFKQLMDIIEDLLKKTDRVVYHGWVDKRTLADGWLSADYWFYPCNFKETFCLTALEAALTRTLAITNGLAALENTVGDRGLTIDIKNEDLLEVYNEDWQDRAIGMIKSIVNNLDYKNELLDKNFNWANNLSWSNRALEFVENFIDPIQYQLEYFNMYNWTNNLLVTDNFYKSLDLVKPINNTLRLLEIGTYTGISIIGFINYFSNKFMNLDLKVDVIDNWNNYNENNNNNNLNNFNKDLDIKSAFYRNMNKLNFDNYINNVFEGNSKDILIDLVNSSNDFFKFYDFIYIDASHKALDVYLDLFLSTKILKINGIVAIDDCFFNNNNILETPLPAVIKFIEENKDNFKLLCLESRTFLQKIK